MNINLYCGQDVCEKAFNENSLRNLVLLYYPCESFSQKENHENGDRLDVSLSLDSESLMVARVRLETARGEAEFCEKQSELPDTLDCFGMGKTLVGRAFLRCGQKIFGYMPPFGILTGVRPAKLILPYVCDALYDREKLCKKLTQVCFMSEQKAKLVCEIAEKEAEVCKNLESPSASLYVSVPFCPTRCKYCSFVSYSTERLLSMIPDYVDRMIEEIHALGKIVGRLKIPIKSVYTGGGTPSVLSAEQADRVLSALFESFDLSRISEFTYEAGRPDTVTAEKLAVLRKYGVERISINTQSANDAVLKSVGRNHTFEDYLAALELAKDFGFSCINTDLIAGLPGESPESFKKSVDKVIEAGPTNITVHSFSVKRAAQFKADGDYSFTEELMRYIDMLSYAENVLPQNGYHPYYIYRQKNTVGNLENVGFAKEGTEGLYNILMMEELHSVFAVGAGAVTKLVSGDGKIISRMFNHKYPYEYLSDDCYLPDAKAIDEFYKQNF